MAVFCCCFFMLVNFSFVLAFSTLQPSSSFGEEGRGLLSLLLLLYFCFVVLLLLLFCIALCLFVGVFFRVIPTDAFLLLLLLQRSTAVQVRSSVRLMPQNQPSGRGLLPSPTAWSPDQHPAAMLADVSRHILGRTEGRGLGFGQLVRTHKGKCLKCQSSSDGHSDHNAL